jgi:hypothetical protein
MSVPAALLKEFILSLSGKAGTTVDAYQRETAALPGLDLAARWKQRSVRRAAAVNQDCPRKGGNPAVLGNDEISPGLESYLTHLQSEGHSVSCSELRT